MKKDARIRTRATLNLFSLFLFLNSIFSYLAAKAHYFGTGGNVNQFEEYLLKDGLLEADSCFSYDEGLRREILRIKFRKKVAS